MSRTATDDPKPPSTAPSYETPPDAASVGGRLRGHVIEVVSAGTGTTNDSSVTDTGRPASPPPP